MPISRVFKATGGSRSPARVGSTASTPRSSAASPWHESQVARWLSTSSRSSGVTAPSTYAATRSRTWRRSSSTKSFAMARLPYPYADADNSEAPRGVGKLGVNSLNVYPFVEKPAVAAALLSTNGRSAATASSIRVQPNVRS